MISDTFVDRYVKLANTRAVSELRHRGYMRLFCICLGALAGLLPLVASRAFATASAYWLDGEGAVHDLDRAREECWKYLDSIGSNTTLSSPAVIATRAVICALYPEPQGEEFDEETLRWFVMLLNKLGDYSKVFSDASSLLI